MTDILRLIFIAVVVLSQTGCGNFMAAGAGDRARGCAGTDCAVISSRFKATTGLVKQSQLFPALQSCLGIPDASVSAQTKSTFDTIKLSLSAEGNVSDMNAPMMMAITQLSGEMCNDLAAYEVSTKTAKFYGYFDIFPTGVTNAVDLGLGAGGKATLQTTIAKFARACWGRDPMSFEIDKIIEQFKASSVGGKTDKGAALFLCTLTLSSPDVAVY